MKIQGVIEKKSQSEGTGKTGKPYIRYLFTVNGKDYSTFNADIFNQFAVGKVVEMEGEQNGLFFNMKTMTEIGEMPVPVVKPGEKVAEKPVKQEFHLTAESCRVEALKCAIATIGDTDKDGDLFDLAKKFLEFIENGN